MRYGAAAGINLSALGSSRILSLLLAGSKSNKQEDKWRARKAEGEKKWWKKGTEREKQLDFLCQPLSSGDRYIVK